MRIDRTTAMRLAAMVAGAAYMTACFKVPELIQLDPVRHLLLAFAVLLPVAFVLAALTEKESWTIALFLFVGVGLGVVVDAALDKGSRNLFPLEIAWWFALFAPAIIVGAALDWLVRKYRGKKAQR